MMWARDVGVPLTNRAMRAAARAVPGVRFLDLTGALDGHQVCAPGVTHTGEWAGGVSVDLRELRNGAGPNLVQHSLHPNSRGHAVMAGCLRRFFRWRASVDGRCLPDGRGGLRLQAG
jgi:hypothetical protein